MTGGMKMINGIIHPGIVLILVGFIAMIAPKNIRKIVLAVGPVAALYGAFNLNLGTEVTICFTEAYKLNVIFVDRLSWVFTFIFAIMAVIGGIYSSHNRNRMEALCSMSYAGCAIGVTLAKDWITLIFFWEILAVTSMFLIWCNKVKASRKAGFRYLLVHMFGGNLLLLGIFLKASHGDLLITNLASGVHDAAFWCIFVGMAINAALPPFNAWLVDAYPEGTITGSVFLSSFTTKVAVYCILRVFAGEHFLMIAGAVMALYGACYAIIENDMRRLLGYHIISQVGFMIAGAGIGTHLAVNGATAHAFSHILYKSLLFMCAGAIIYATGIRKINQLGNLKEKMPVVTFCFFVAAFSISGVPLFNGFISKAITIHAASLSGYAWLYTLLELASIGTFLSIPLKMGYFIFLRKDDKEVRIKANVPFNMYLGMGLGSLLCIVYGIYPDLLYRYLPYTDAVYEPFLPEYILQYIQMLVVIIVPFMMYLTKMEPHTAISLDTDWLYRRPLAFMIKECSFLLCALSSALGESWNMLYKKFMDLTSNPMEFLDARPFREKAKYDPENYRTSVADPIMITLTVLVFAVGYFVSSL